MRRLKSALLTAAGFVLLGIGAVGALLPVLPTTPFVLLAAACFGGNPRARARLMKVGFFRQHFENYKERTGLPASTVIKSLAFLWVMLALSMLRLGRLSLPLICVGLAVTAHILSISRPKRG